MREVEVDVHTASAAHKFVVPGRSKRLAGMHGRLHTLVSVDAFECGP